MSGDDPSGRKTHLPDPVGKSAVERGGVDWRMSVQLSYRNHEVRVISGVLASLEPGATSSSKLRLAMQFEDMVFKLATSLADYHKRLKKRLKKVQKSYVPSTRPMDTMESKVVVMQKLRSKYGNAITYVLKHAETAVQQMKVKHGIDKSNQLRQHTDSVLEWAKDLGLTSAPSSIHAPLSDVDVNRLQSFLERRMDNIHSHVMKLADPDGFLGEVVTKIENDLTRQTSRVLAATVKNRYEQLSRSTSSVNAPAMIHQALHTINQPVPLPTRYSDEHANDIRLALIHLDKTRASSMLMLGWAMVADKSLLNDLPVSVRNHLLTKAHATSMEGMDIVTRAVQNVRKKQGEKSSSVICLEDAWKMTLVTPSSTADALNFEAATPTTTTTTTTTFQRALHFHPVIRSRILLTPGRRPPSHFLIALKRKRAQLILPPPRGEGSHILVDFGTAFTMTIYLVPLLVTLRAQTPMTTTLPRDQYGSTMPRDQYGSTITISDGPSLDPTIINHFIMGGGAIMRPLCHSLHQYTQEMNHNSYKGSGRANARTVTGEDAFRVWGVQGPKGILGRVVEERLRDAGAQATRVLRTFFAQNQRETATEFEIELLEATALLEFLQLVRTTFQPDWNDIEV